LRECPGAGAFYLDDVSAQVSQGLGTLEVNQQAGEVEDRMPSREFMGAFCLWEDGRVGVEQGE